MALTPEQIKLMSAEGSGPPLTLEQSELMRRMFPENNSDYNIRLNEQPNTTMMGFFNDGQPANLEQASMADAFNPVTGYTGNNMGGPFNPETGGLYDLQNPFDQSAILPSSPKTLGPKMSINQPGDIIGLPDMKYEGDSPFGSVINDFYGSGGGRGPMTMDMVYNPFTGQHGSSSQMGEMYDFISGAYGDMQGQMNNDMVKSQDFLDKFNLYGDAMKAYNDYDFMQGITTQGPDGTAQLPGPIMQPPSLGPFDPNFVPSSPFDPVTSTGGYESSTGTAPDTTDIFGAGNNPINNPIAPMPSPITPPPKMNSSHSHDDLLQGIGKLFEQYFPNQGSNFNQSTTQPMFDAVGNSAPAQQTAPQVFGNMITPFGRQG